MLFRLKKIYMIMCPSRGCCCVMVATILIISTKAGLGSVFSAKARNVNQLPKPIASRNSQWFSNGCSQVSTLLTKKANVEAHVNKLMKQLSKSSEIGSSEIEKEKYDLKLELYSLFLKEINQSEYFVLSALDSFGGVLKGDVNDIELLKANTKYRINQLQYAIFAEEKELNKVSEIETKLTSMQGFRKQINESSSVKQMFVDMMNELHLAAADLSNGDGDDEDRFLKKEDYQQYREKHIGEIEAVYQVLLHNSCTRKYFHLNYQPQRFKNRLRKLVVRCKARL